MNFELYLAFVVAATVLIVVPGPNVMLIVAHSIGRGPRRALASRSGTTFPVCPLSGQCFVDFRSEVGSVL